MSGNGGVYVSGNGGVYVSGNVGVYVSGNVGVYVSGNVGVYVSGNVEAKRGWLHRGKNLPHSTHRVADPDTDGGGSQTRRNVGVYVGGNVDEKTWVVTWEQNVGVCMEATKTTTFRRVCNPPAPRCGFATRAKPVVPCPLPHRGKMERGLPLPATRARKICYTRDEIFHLNNVSTCTTMAKVLYICSISTTKRDRQAAKAQKANG